MMGDGPQMFLLSAAGLSVLKRGVLINSEQQRNIKLAVEHSTLIRLVSGGGWAAGGGEYLGYSADNCVQGFPDNTSYHTHCAVQATTCRS